MYRSDYKVSFVHCWYFSQTNVTAKCPLKAYFTGEKGKGKSHISESLFKIPDLRFAIT